ncbi:MAG TPA: hypothetical protein VI138_08365 [Candidatus Dormibacteraeota bacterium]
MPADVSLAPLPITEYAEINLAVPDLGDADPGELLHVVWVVVATPEVVTWSWPDGTRSLASVWVPQSYVQGGTLAGTLSYQVTATGFWSDGVHVHELPSESVGTIPVGAQLAYSVEQIQPALG